jgi:hypothetical protein
VTGVNRAAAQRISNVSFSLMSKCDYYEEKDFYPGAMFVELDKVWADDNELGNGFVVVAVTFTPKYRGMPRRKVLMLLTSDGKLDIGRNTDGWPKDSIVKIA